MTDEKLNKANDLRSFILRCETQIELFKNIDRKVNLEFRVSDGFLIIPSTVIDKVNDLCVSEYECHLNAAKKEYEQL